MADTIDYTMPPVPPTFGQPVSAAHGSAVAAALRASRIYAGTGIRIDRTLDGCTISTTGTNKSIGGGSSSGESPRMGTVVSMPDSPQGKVRVVLDNGIYVGAYLLNATYSTRILPGLKVLLYPVQISVIPGEMSDGSEEGTGDLFFFRAKFGRPIPCKSARDSGKNIFINLSNALFCLDDESMVVVHWSDIKPPESENIPNVGANRILYRDSLELSIDSDVITPQEAYIDGYPAWYGRGYGLRWRSSDSAWILYPYSGKTNNPTSWTDWETGEIVGNGWWSASDIYGEFSPAGADADGRDAITLNVSLGENLVHQGDNAESGTLFGTYKSTESGGKTITVGAQMYIDSHRSGRIWSIEGGKLRRGSLVVGARKLDGVDGFGFNDPNQKGIIYWSSELPDKCDATFLPYTTGEDGVLVPADDADSLTLTYKGYGEGTVKETRLIWVVDAVQLI